MGKCGSREFVKPFVEVDRRAFARNLGETVDKQPNARGDERLIVAERGVCEAARPGAPPCEVCGRVLECDHSEGRVGEETAKEF